MGNKVSYSFSYSFLFAFFILISQANAQQEDGYTVLRYTSKNGLPQNSIKSVVMDENRFIWLTTEGGIVRYDGKNIKLFNSTSTPQITNDRFSLIQKTVSGQFITEDVNGTVYVIHDSKVRVLQNHSANNETAPRFRGAVPDTTFYLRSKSKKHTFQKEKDVFSDPYVIIPLTKDNYLVKTFTGLREFKNDQFVRDIKISENKPFHVFTLQNKIYYFDHNNQLFQLELHTALKIPIIITGDLSYETIKKLSLEQNIIWNNAYPEVYIKSGNALFRIKVAGNNLANTSLLLRNLPENCFLTDVHYDLKSNNYFIGTDNKGFYVYKKQEFKTLIHNDEKVSNGNSFCSQLVLDSNRVYAGYGIEFTIDGPQPSKLPLEKRVQECLISDSRNRIVFSEDDKLYAMDINSGLKTPIINSDSNSYSAFYKDGDSILVGSQKGIGYISGDKYIHLKTLEPKNPNDRIETIIRGPDGKIWFGTCTGVYRINSLKERPEVIRGLNNKCARTFYISKGRLFIGTYGQGFYMWQKGKLTAFPIDKNNALTHVHSFMIDNRNFFWISTNNGLLKTTLDHILHFAELSRGFIPYYFYEENEGINNSEFNGGCSPPMVYLKNGYVSYPTIEGLVWFNPDKVRTNIPDGKLVVDDLIINGINIEPTDSITISSSDDKISFRVSTPYYGNHENLYIQYKVEGLHKDWNTIVDDDQLIVLSDLPAGNYTLKIRNLLDPGSLAEPDFLIPLTVEKMFYETTWFRAGSATVLILTLFLMIRLNSIRIVRKNRLLEEKINERTSELQVANGKLSSNLHELEVKEKTLKESIQLKDRLISVISHDIITPLKFISMVSRHSKKAPIEHPEKYIETMNDIEFASEKLYNNASNILNWIKVQNHYITPAKSHIALYELIEECFEPITGMAEIKNISLINNIPEEMITLSDKNILYIILHNLLTNSVKYTDRGFIKVEYKEEGTKCYIIVTDTGIGMTEKTIKYIENILAGKGANHLNDEGDGTGNRIGYFIIADLLRYIDGQVTIKSSHGEGTTVSLKFGKCS